MDIRKLIPGDYSAYFAHFNRSDYAGYFRRYTEIAEAIFSALSSEDEAEAAAKELAVHCGTLPRRFFRKADMFDLKSLLALYTVPAALKFGTAAAKCFADTLVAEWGRLYPAYSFTAGSYGELMQGFENAGIMGFNVKWGGKEK